MQCRRCVVSGRVQGVFYRQNAKEKALALNLTGWVRNLTNGDVECVICGDNDAVEAMCEWLWQGPDLARVSDVAVKTIPFEHHTGFQVR